MNAGGDNARTAATRPHKFLMTDQEWLQSGESVRLTDARFC